MGKRSTCCLILSVLLLLSSRPGCAQALRPDKAVHSLEAVVEPGLIFQTHDFLKGANTGNRTLDRSFGIHLKYAFRFPFLSRNGKLYPYAYQGIGTAWNTFCNRTELGNPVALYFFQGSRITALGRNLSLDYEWNFGISAGWKPYDEDSNPYNQIIGSALNAYMNLAFLFNWRIGPHWRIKAGIGATHYSNGNSHSPNFGLNTAGTRISLCRIFGKEQSETGRSVLPCVRIRPHMVYDIVVFGAMHSKGISEVAQLAPGSYGAFGLNLNPMYCFNKYLKAGVSLDSQFDQSANLGDHIGGKDENGELLFYRPSFRERFGMGLSLRLEFSMPIFSIHFGVGQNFLYKGKDLSNPYQLLALKIHVHPRIFLHIGYQLDKLHEPRNLMLGFGLRFNDGKA